MSKQGTRSRMSLMAALLYFGSALTSADAQPFRSRPDASTYPWRDLTNELRNKMTGAYVVASAQFSEFRAS